MSTVIPSDNVLIEKPELSSSIQLPASAAPPNTNANTKSELKQDYLEAREDHEKISPQGSEDDDCPSLVHHTELASNVG